MGRVAWAGFRVRVCLRPRLQLYVYAWARPELPSGWLTRLTGRNDSAIPHAPQAKCPLARLSHCCWRPVDCGHVNHGNLILAHARHPRGAAIGRTCLDGEKQSNLTTLKYVQKA